MDNTQKILYPLKGFVTLYFVIKISKYKNGLDISMILSTEFKNLYFKLFQKYQNSWFWELDKQ